MVMQPKVGIKIASHSLRQQCPLFQEFAVVVPASVGYSWDIKLLLCYSGESYKNVNNFADRKQLEISLAAKSSRHIEWIHGKTEPKILRYHFLKQAFPQMS